MAAKQYNPNEMIFTFAGLSIKGFSNETFIAIERTTDGSSSSVGAGGEVTVEIKSDDRKQITLTLQRTSKDNALLTAVWQTQRLTGEVLFSPMTIKDGLGNDLHTAPQSWLMNEPNADYGAESGTREWLFEAAKMVSIHGGS